MSLVHPAYPIGGCDISSWQVPIRYDELYAKINFILLRAGHPFLRPDWEDDTFQRSRREAESVQLPWGSYWYLEHEVDPEAQARAYIEFLGNKMGDIGAYLDLEDRTINGVKYVLTAANKTLHTQNAIKFLKIVDAKLQSSGSKQRYCGIYSNSYWNEFIYHSQIPNLKERWVWQAQYFNNWPMPKPTMKLNGMASTSFWQFTDEGSNPHNKGGNGKQWGVGSFGLDMNAYLGSAKEFELKFGIKPKEVLILPTACKPFQSGYNIRAKPSELSLSVASTRYAAPIEVMGETVDEKNACWYQLGKGMWIHGSLVSLVL